MLEYIIILYLFTQFKDSRTSIIKTEINRLKIVVLNLYCRVTYIALQQYSELYYVLRIILIYHERRRPTVFTRS